MDRTSTWLGVLIVLMAPLTLGSVCEGTGANRPGSITQGPIDPRCTPIGGPFPAGFDLLPGAGHEAVATRFLPAGLLRFDMRTTPPMPNNAGPVASFPPDSSGNPNTVDSDGDGVDDATAFQRAGLCAPQQNGQCRNVAKVGSTDAAFEQVVLVTASEYEEVLFYDAASSMLAWLDVEHASVGASPRELDRPLYPPIGTSAPRSALSTMVCAYPPNAVDSTGAAIGPDARCDPSRAGFLTRFTGATALAGGRLFVATSNLSNSALAAFDPGTVLVHDLTLDASGRPIRVTPNGSTPIVFTTAFNPTGLTAHRTPGGRDVVLVTQTGAIDAAGGLHTDSALDVIDVASLRVVATIPLGRAGAAFGELAIDPGGHIALVGAESARSLFAVDLAALDDPALYAPRVGPAVLDGSTPGFADARIFDAQSPFALPRRPDGPPDALCTPRTNVTLNHSGALAYTTDWCDGSLSIVSIDWSLPLERPISGTRFSVQRRLDWFAPKWPANFGLAAAPGSPRTRPGVPGVDFDGPDLFFLINETEGQLCSARVEL